MPDPDWLKIKEQQKWMIRFLIIYAIVQLIILVVFFVLLLSVQAVLAKYILAQWVPGVEPPDIPFYLKPLLNF